VAQLHEKHERRRRNSESSVWEFGPEPVDRAQGRPRSYSSSSRPGVAHSNKLLDNHLSNHAVQPSRNTARSQSFGRSNEGRNIGAWLTANSQSKHHESQRSNSPHRHSQVNGNDTGMTSVSQISDNSQALGALSLSFHDNALVIEHGQGQLRTTQNPIAVSNTLLDIKAALIEHHRVQNSLRRIWHLWHQSAVQSWEDNGNLKLLARHRDKQPLILGEYI